MPELVTYEGDRYEARPCSVQELKKGDLVCFNLDLTAMAAWRVIASIRQRNSRTGEISFNLRYEGPDTAFTAFRPDQVISHMVLIAD